MTITGALGTATQGADSQGSKLSIISQNMANVDTTGYAKKDVIFSSLVTGTSVGGSSTGGVTTVTRNLIDQQGLIESSSRATDLAISGKGFFAVQDEAANLYFTRAGNFSINNRGELENAAGFKLMAWPLDNDGLKPGTVGNTNTTPAEATSSLNVVDINAISGTASATTTIGMGLNLNAGQSIFQGATITLDLQSNANNTIGQSAIIAPTSTANSSMQAGDEISLQQGSNAAVTFQYGGFANSRILASTNTVFGSSTSSAVFQTGTTLTDGHKFTIDTTSSLSSAVTLTFKASSPDTLSGEFNSLDTLATAIDSITGLTARVTDDQLLVSSTNANDAVTFTNVDSSDIIGNIGLSNIGAGTGNRFNTILGLSTLINAENDFGALIVNPTDATELQIYAADPQETLTVTKTHENAVVNLSSAENGTNNLTGLIVPTKNHSSYEIENTAGIATGSVLTLSDGTNTGTFVYGGVLESASIADTSADLGLTDGVDNIVIGGTTFTYDTGLGAQQFTTIDNLATAINNEGTFRARVVNNRLYVATVSAANADAAITMAGTAASFTAIGGDFGAAGTPVAAYAGTGNRFNTMEQLDALVDAVTNMTGTATGSSATTQILVEVTDDSQLTIAGNALGGGNVELLRDLGLKAGTVGDGFFAEMEFNTIIDSTEKSDSIARSYDPNDASNKNIAGGGITAHFTRNIRVFDSLGTGHDFQMSFLKTGTNEWAVEFYAIDATDITNGGTDGIIASGEVTFNGDGSLRNVTGSIANEVTISWANGAESNAVTFDLGTAGLPASIAGDTQPGLTDGLRQFDSSFNVEFVEQNGVAAGQFNNISIDEDGNVNANFTNGEVKTIFKIPIVIVANDNALRELSGNVYQTTQASGEPNLKDAGTGNAGAIVPFATEGSTADIAEELTETIPTQANYNANLKVITVADEMLERLTSI